MRDVIQSWFASEDWPVDVKGDGNVMLAAYQGDSAVWRCLIVVYEPDDRAMFYSVCPFRPTADRFAAVVEAVARINDGLHYGNFEISFEDFGIRFKTTIDVEAAELTPALWRNVVVANLATMDQYLPALDQVIRGADPRLAIEVAEDSDPAWADDLTEG